MSQTPERAGADVEIPREGGFPHDIDEVQFHYSNYVNIWVSDEVVRVAFWDDPAPLATRPLGGFVLSRSVFLSFTEAAIKAALAVRNQSADDTGKRKASR